MSPPSISPSDAEYITGILNEFSRLMLAAATRCGPPGETEDILSDASLYLLRHVAQLRSIKTSRQQAVYIYKVTQHTAYKHGAKFRRRWAKRTETEWDEEPAEDDFSKEVENRLDMDSALKTLKPRDRDILLFYYIWGYSVKEIAEIMGLRVGTAGVYLQRARERARKAMEGER